MEDSSRQYKTTLLACRVLLQMKAASVNINSPPPTKQKKKEEKKLRNKEDKFNKMEYRSAVRTQPSRRF